MILGALLAALFFVSCILYEKYRSEKIMREHYEKLFEKLSRKIGISEIDMEKEELLRDL